MVDLVNIRQHLLRIEAKIDWLLGAGNTSKQSAAPMTPDPRLTRAEASKILETHCFGGMLQNNILDALAAANAFRPEPLADGKYEVWIKDDADSWIVMLYRREGIWRSSPDANNGFWPDSQVTPIARLREEPL